jgi:hypothetical protein
MPIGSYGRTPPLNPPEGSETPNDPTTPPRSVCRRLKSLSTAARVGHGTVISMPGPLTPKRGWKLLLAKRPMATRSARSPGTWLTAITGIVRWGRRRSR